MIYKQKPIIRGINSIMKKSLALLAVLGCFSQSSMAVTTFGMANFTTLAYPTAASAQTAFHSLAADFGSALSYKPITPAAPLGITGFDVGIAVSATDMANSAAVWNTLTGSSAPGTLVVPKLYAAKGLPFGIDVAAFYTAVPTTDIVVTGGAISYALIGGDMLMPAITIRGAVTNLSGIPEFTFGTKSLDISISKGFLGITPYAGVGQVWVTSATTNATALLAGITSENFTQTKTFVGLNINLGLPNLALEGDTTGGTSSYSAKLGIRW
jgi:hypothetical protein